ncbi:MAG: hypothetical protein R6U96_16800 [Promethearchaeia archaeon]
MLKKIGKKGIILISILVVMIFFSNIIMLDNVEVADQDNPNTPQTSATFDASVMDNIEITEIDRKMNVSGFGLLNVEDKLTVKNLNDNPVSSMFIAIPSHLSEDLIFYEAKGSQKESILVDKTDKLTEDHELFVIYFNSPILPSESKEITFIQSYKDRISFSPQQTEEGITQVVSYIGSVYPTLPYKAKGEIETRIQIPETASLEEGDWGTADENNMITYNIDDFDGANTLDPLLENMGKKNITIHFTDSTQTKLEFQSVNRKIKVSPWGILRVKEEFLIQNLGAIEVTQLSMKIPGPARQVNVYDDLGEISGTEITPESNYTHLEFKDLDISLIENRVKLDPYSKFRFSIEYHLPYGEYFNLNWFQHSCELETLTSQYDYLAKEQETEIQIEGAFSLDSLSRNPNDIERAVNYIELSYNSDYITPYDTQELQFTYTINLFDILFRPIVLMLLIASIGALYVVIIKSREREVEGTFIVREELPDTEIREFCSLYEEKFASMLEIRRAQEARKRKKISKKRYRNLVEKNKDRVEEIDEEIKPFKEKLRETNETFANIVKKLEFLEAESISVKDSLQILRARYRKGRLPSKNAYLKLTDQLKRRRKKIERNMNKLITQLRSYLL